MCPPPLDHHHHHHKISLITLTCNVNLKWNDRIKLSHTLLPRESVCLTPYTLHPSPYTLHPTPCTLHPTPYTACHLHSGLRRFHRKRSEGERERQEAHAPHKQRVEEGYGMDRGGGQVTFHHTRLTEPECGLNRKVD